jgi:ubiquinone/menaquinone biosynthesis C-methylase UbiE
VSDSGFIKTHYQDEATARAYDGERFATIVGRTFDHLEKRALAAIVRRVRRQIADPTVLDIPCGTGRITEFLLEQGLTVVGGDISPAMIAVAREKCRRFGTRVSWMTLDLDSLHLRANSVDLATCIRLFHHIESDARAAILCELARVTRRFVIVNVSFSSPMYRARRRLKRALGQGISRAGSTSEEIEREAASAGLEVVARRFIAPALSEDLVLLLRKR